MSTLPLMNVNANAAEAETSTTASTNGSDLAQVAHTNGDQDGNDSGSHKRKAEDADIAARRRTRGPLEEERSLPTGSSQHSVGVGPGDPQGVLQEIAPSTATPVDPAEGADEVVSLFIEIDPLPVRAQRFHLLSTAEIQELERVLELDGDESWRSDWAGNLAFVDKEIRNPKVRSREKQAFRQTLIEWARNAPENVKYVWNLVRYVLKMKETPEPARRILSNTDSSSLTSLEKAIRLTSYHPIVLQHDGWTTAKSPAPLPPIGGPHLIGNRIRWEHSDSVIIAYVHDPDIGDLWKAMSTDRADNQTFDLEAEELLDAKRKYERRQERAASRRPNKPVAVNSEFRVDGLELGIVLAASYSKGSRPGVFWPARLMHASEAQVSTGKRSSSKQKVDVVFLSPYWSSDDSGRSRRVESLSENDATAFYLAPTLQIETIDATEDMIRPYHSDGDDEIDIDALTTSFRFTGLPKTVFSRFLDSHRLALALRKYAKHHLKREITATERATAGLFECHPMTIQAPIFPNVVLNLPFIFMLSQLPRQQTDTSVLISTSADVQRREPVVDLKIIVDSMRPPTCFGLLGDGHHQTPTKLPRVDSIHTTPGSWLMSMKNDNGVVDVEAKAESFFHGLPNLNSFFASETTYAALTSLKRDLLDLIEKSQNSIVACTSLKPDTTKEERVVPLFKLWSLLKKNGEQVISSCQVDPSLAVVSDWRRAMERLYKYMVCMPSGRGPTVVLTDLRCNAHLTNFGCLERSVRLPAALKGARLAAAEGRSLKLIAGVSDEYVSLAEKCILPRVHNASYLKKMKSRCASAPSDDAVVMLTDDSEGRGGEDTMGSKGTWTAAVCGVAAGLNIAEMVVHGKCINGFVISRPPGHHAGRNLHSMKAISNGFCILNTAACVAIYATTPLSEGGLGLSRACVIDFDVHHGNGTQDILCSTYDPRYLYISMHAGGPEVNGAPHDDHDDPNHELHDLASNPKSGGIYPGRCGDTSPHKGVLNIPLGSKVTPHDIGTALVQKVTPAVDAFAPDLIIVSAGFDAHHSDPMGLGSLSASDFGVITDVACSLALKNCSGRLVSILEGGYGVPCCRPQRDSFPQFCQPTTLPAPMSMNDATVSQSQETDMETLPQSSGAPVPFAKERLQPSRLLDVGQDLPESMDDQVPYVLQRRLERCHAEGFVECVKEHVSALAKFTD